MIRRWLVAVWLPILLLPAAAMADGEGVVTTKLLETSLTNTGAPIVYPTTDRPAITVAIVEIAPGAATPEHRHPYPLVGYILEGTLEVTAADGTVNRYEAGDALVEALDQNHHGRNVGDTPVRVLITVMGIDGEPISIIQQ
jgi:quercetin dioxygenase-like cupin family protein